MSLAPCEALNKLISSAEVEHFAKHAEDWSTCSTIVLVLIGRRIRFRRDASLVNTFVLDVLQLLGAEAHRPVVSFEGRVNRIAPPHPIRPRRESRPNRPK